MARHERLEVDDDSDDVRAAASGDVRAFERLYRRHVGQVRGVICRLLGAASARADDLVQEAFVRAWTRLDGFRHDSRFSTWLHRLAVNTALMDLRAARARPGRGDDTELSECAATVEARPGLQLDLERAVAALPPRARSILVLHDIEQWQHQEIAAELGIAVGTSKAQLHRARGLLRSMLED